MVTVKPEDVGVVPGFYLNPEGNGYRVIGIAENERTGERVVTYQKVTNHNDTVSKLLFLPVGSFESEVDRAKGFKYFSRWPRTLGLYSKPGSRVDRES